MVVSSRRRDDPDAVYLSLARTSHTLQRTVLQFPQTLKLFQTDFWVTLQFAEGRIIHTSSSSSNDNDNIHITTTIHHAPSLLVY